jgi:Domain of unknown function (DUF4476)
VDLARWRDPSRRITISVIPNRPVPPLLLLAPVEMKMLDQPVHNKYCGCNCSKIDGLVSVTLVTDRRSYAPGEYIDFSGSTAVSDVSEPLLLRIRLIQYIVMRSSSGFETTRFLKHELFRGECPANSNVDVARLFNGRIRMPSVFPSFHGGVETPPTRTKYSCLKWTYALELKIGGGSGKSGVSAYLPILVSCAAPYPQSVESAKSLFVASRVDDSPFSVLENTINSAGPCDTTPYITGAEDGGVLVPAYTYGTGVATNTVEDAGAVGKNPNFQPYVNTFDEVNVKALSEEVRPLTFATSSDPVASSTVGVASSIAPLLKDMEDSFDKRQSVGKWIRGHPLQATQLTPVQVKDILSAVSFSLEQPAVAVEVAVGLGHKLTCEHVLAAVQVCRYQQVDVAKAMAPFVNDPQNKQSVLSQIEYSFEREAVSQCFRS